MILSILIVEIFRMCTPNANKEVYDTMGIHVLNFAGAINLFIACYPLTKYRATVFFVNIFITFVMSCLALSGVLSSFLSLVAFIPIADHLPNLLIIVLIILADMPIAIGLQKLFSKLNLTKIIKKH